MNPLLSFFVALLMLHSTPPPKTVEAQLSALVGSRRVVVLYAPTAADADYLRQKKWFDEAQSALLERDLVVIDCAGSDLSATDAQHLKNRFQYAPSHFCLWLIGKDGGLKLSQQKAVLLPQLFGLIDSMPMRQAEMRRN